MEELIKIQSELKVPKSQYNSFGKYHYRSLEDILEALKPLLQQHKCFLTLVDSIEYIEGRFYIKAEAVLTNNDGEKVISTAYAREAELKKGMDESQITGAASSYARKYALNGLFCIDDTKEADTHPPETDKPQNKTVFDKNNTSQKKSTKNKTIDASLIKAVQSYATLSGFDVKKYIEETYSKTSVKGLSTKEAMDAINNCKAFIANRNKWDLDSVIEMNYKQIKEKLGKGGK